MINLLNYSKFVFKTEPAPDPNEGQKNAENPLTNPNTTDLVRERKIAEGIKKRIDETVAGGVTIEEIDRRTDAKIKPIDERVKSIEEQFEKKEIKGAKGDKGDNGEKGDKGEKGDTLKFEDLTDTQIAELKGERGAMPDFGALDADQKKKLKQLISDLGFGGIDAGLGTPTPTIDAETKGRLDDLDARQAALKAQADKTDNTLKFFIDNTDNAIKENREKINNVDSKVDAVTTTLGDRILTLENDIKTIAQIDPKLVEDIQKQLEALKGLNVEGLKDLPQRLHEVELSLGSLQKEVEARSVDPEKINDLDAKIKEIKKLTDDFVASDADNKDQINKLSRTQLAQQPEPAPRKPRTRKPAGAQTSTPKTTPKRAPRTRTPKATSAPAAPVIVPITPEKPKLTPEPMPDTEDFAKQPQPVPGSKVPETSDLLKKEDDNPPKAPPTSTGNPPTI